MKTLFAILITILVIDQSIQVNLRLLSQHVQQEIRNNRILNRDKKGVQETDEEDQTNQTENKVVTAKVQVKNPQHDIQSSLDEGNSTSLQSQTQSNVTSEDNYTKNELPDTEQDIKDQEQRQKQLEEAMKNKKPKDEENRLNLIVFSLFFGFLGIFI